MANGIDVHWLFGSSSKNAFIRSASGFATFSQAAGSIRWKVNVPGSTASFAWFFASVFDASILQAQTLSDRGGSANRTSPGAISPTIG